MRQVRTLMLLALLVLAGCSGSSDSGAGGGTGGTAQPSGTVVTNFTLLRAVPSIITDFRFFFFNAGGNVVYGPFTVAKASQVTLTGVPTGATTMRIEYLQNGTLRGIANVAVTVTNGGVTTVNDPPFQDVGSQVQQVVVTPIEDSAPVGTRVQYAATAIFFDGQTQDVTSSATWTSSNEAIATVSNSTGTHGRATAVAAGSATISADFGGVSGNSSLTVRAAVLQSLQVSPANSAIARGTSQAYVALGTFSDGTTENLTAQVAWTTSDNTIATVDGAGLATAVNTGQANITATDPGTGVADSAVLNVTAAVLQRLDVTPDDATVPVGYCEQFLATGLYSDGTSQNLTSSVTWTSSNPAVASVSNAAGEDGVATGLAVGTASISAEMPGTGITGAGQLEVTSAVLEFVEVAPFSPTLADGETLRFAAVGIFSDNTTEDLTDLVLWSSGDESIAHVSNASGSRGLARALQVGQADIIATDRNTGIDGSSLLTVGAPVLQTLSVTPADDTVALGAEVPYTAMGTYSDASVRNVTSLVAWTSSDDSVASISNTAGSPGLASTHAAGTTTIAAELDGVSGQTGLTVTAATLVSLAVTPVNPNLPVGLQRQFTATGTYSDASTEDLTHEVTWSSSVPARATISNAPGSEGLARGVATGATTITATLGAVSGATTLTVTGAVLQSITVTPANQSVGSATFLAYTATGNFSDASTLDLTSAVTWRSSNRLSALISNHPFTKGVAVSILPGNTTISARLPNAPFSGSTNLNVQ